MNDEVPTLGEVCRRLDNLETSLEKWESRLDLKLDGIRTGWVSKEVYDVEHSYLVGRIDKLEASAAITLAYHRSVILAIIIALLSLLGVVFQHFKI